MSATDTIALLALVVGATSLGWQIKVWYADRTRLSARSKYYTFDEYGPPQLVISVAVDGPRAVVLRMLCMVHSNGNWSGEFLESDKGGVRLADGGHFEKKLSGEDLSCMDRDSGEIHDAVDFYFEDTLGRKYPIKKCRENLVRVRELEREWCEIRRREKLLIIPPSA